MARVHVYQSDPFVMFAERIDADNDWSDWYEIPEELMAEYEATEAAYKASIAAIEAHITENKLTAHESKY